MMQQTQNTSKHPLSDNIKEMLNHLETIEQHLDHLKHIHHDRHEAFQQYQKSIVFAVSILVGIFMFIGIMLLI